MKKDRILRKSGFKTWDEFHARRNVLIADQLSAMALSGLSSHVDWFGSEELKELKFLNDLGAELVEIQRKEDKDGSEISEWAI